MSYKVCRSRPCTLNRKPYTAPPLVLPAGRSILQATSSVERGRLEPAPGRIQGPLYV